MIVRKILWTLWLQGWENAPPLVKTCLDSWRVHHPTWTIVELSLDNLAIWLELDELLPDGKWRKLPPAALSDIIRTELLATYGGVWVDSTLYCTRPLDEWLPNNMPNGFFAFASPGPDRMLASWFLATTPDHYLIQEWRRRVRAYWFTREEAGAYFWLHYLFGDAYGEDSEFRRLWDAVPKITADGAHFFYPCEERLEAPVKVKDLFAIERCTSPVFKLSHKISSEPAPPGSVMAYLLRRQSGGQPALKSKEFRARPAKVAFEKSPEGLRTLYSGLQPPTIKKGAGRFEKATVIAGHLLNALKKKVTSPAKKRILILWYGSLDGHGTVGDLLSAQAVSNALVDAGYEIDCASASVFAGLAGRVVNWRQAMPRDYLAVVFVCGPMIKNHPEINALIGRFRGNVKIGIGVSLFPHDHFNYFDPFDQAFAREGGLVAFEDVAILAPLKQYAPRHEEFTIGVVLSGPQFEYGPDACLDDETQTMVYSAAASLRGTRRGRVIVIENHLRRSDVEPNEIEERYAQCDLIFTSRFHGAMLALRRQVPFVAIDQIRGGGKVSRLLGPKWPFVYQAESTTPEILVNAANSAMNRENLGLLWLVREQARMEAAVSLRELHQSLDVLAGFRR